MTIDEAITTEIEYSQPCDIICKCEPDCDYCRSYHKQLAEWLKELKAYREQHQALCNSYNVHTVEDIYDKAIEDFIKAVDKQCGYYAGECKNLTRDDFLKIAEDLKNT